ncbi:MAG: DNA-binding response OmpR family regulator [Candidatus Azotimanducaceae bacterium]|jgi:DNA-binding response OmpR family regulator
MNDKQTILIIDDKEELGSALSTMLELNGYQTTHAESGEEGLKLALKNHPDLILLDLIMPGMNGLDVLKQLREDTWGATAKIILLTAKEKDNEDYESLGISGEDYLTKARWGLENITEKVAAKLAE